MYLVLVLVFVFVFVFGGWLDFDFEISFVGFGNEVEKCLGFEIEPWFCGVV